MASEQDDYVTGLKQMGPFEITVNFDNRPERLTCPYDACPKCGGCGVCGDFHGTAYGGCNDECPYRPWHRARDWMRQQWAKVRGKRLGWEHYDPDPPAQAGTRP